MEAYSFNNETGIYIGITTAFESPKRKGTYHVPAHSTLIKPPTITDPTKVAQWNENKWSIIDKPPKPLTPEEQELEEFKKNYVLPDPMLLLRSKRNKLLNDVDWMVIKYITTKQPIPESLEKYMQELRDLPSISNPKLKQIDEYYHVLDESSVNWPVLKN